MNLKITLFTFLCLSFSAFAQVEVDVNFDLRHVVGGQDTFDREKFIVIHADATENDYNVELGKLDSLLTRYDAHYGREAGRMRFLASQVSEDPSRPGFANPSSITSAGNQLNTNYNLFQPGKHATQNKGRVITAAQDRPFFPDGTSAGNFAFSQADGPADDDFGTATGEFMALFLRDGYGDNPTSGADGPPRPTWIEVINEPFFPLVDFTQGAPAASTEEIFELHRTVAKEIKAVNPDALVGGFTNAFPDLQFFGKDAGNQQLFGQWEERWKRFIDEVGEDMDFYSIHLYDFPSIQGSEILRKGGNIEATLDMIEHYNTIQWGSVKPWVISEYGSQLNDFFGQNWSPGRDWFMLRAFSSMMMQFMERPDVIEKTVPFVLARAEFLYAGAGVPGFVYPWRMMRRAEESPAPTGGALTQANLFPAFPNFTAPVDQEYDFTEIIKFYELWADVNGTRVDTKSTDLDLMVDAYVDIPNSKAYLILNSLDETDLTVNLNEKGVDLANVTGVNIKQLFLGADGNPTLTSEDFTAVPATVTLREEANMIIEYSFDQTPVVDETSTEQKIYATTYNQNIVANQPITFTIPGVSLGTQGEAVLRLGIGRLINTPLIPVVTVNGTQVSIPADYRGDTQDDRVNRGDQNIFFGMLEADVPYNLLNAGDNTVVVTFPDNGGAISSCALQTFDFTREVIRTSDILSTPDIDNPESKISVYPNPTNNQLHISGKFDNWKIYNVLGFTVKEGEGAAINVTDLATGLYYVSFDNTANKVLKFMKN